MSLALVLGAMATTAAAMLALPLLRKASAPIDRAIFDRTVFTDQLRELESDLARGVIRKAEARAARIEIERRILSTGVESGNDAADACPAAAGSSRALLLALVALVPAAAASLYLVVGRPELPGQPFSERTQPGPTAKRLATAEVARMVAVLERRLAKQPEQIQGWIILTTAYLRLGRTTDAEKALDRALDLAAADKPRAASIAVRYGEELVAMNGGRVVPRAKAAFAHALTLAPRQPAAVYYMGLVKMQAGDSKGALAIWRRLVDDAPASAPWLTDMKKRIESFAK